MSEGGKVRRESEFARAAAAAKAERAAGEGAQDEGEGGNEEAAVGDEGEEEMGGLGVEEEEEERVANEWRPEAWEETYENDEFYEEWPAEGVG